jgi:hypothetical protein
MSKPSAEESFLTQSVADAAALGLDLLLLLLQVLLWRNLEEQEDLTSPYLSSIDDYIHLGLPEWLGL